MSAEQVKSRIYHRLKICFIFAAIAQLIFLFVFLHYIGNPFRDEAYCHLLIGIFVVACVSGWRCASGQFSADNTPKFGIASLFRSIGILEASYLILIVSFLTVAATQATQTESSTGGFSDTLINLCSFGTVYFILTVLFLMLAFPIAVSFIIPLRKLIDEKRISRRAFNLFGAIILITMFYFLLLVFLAVITTPFFHLSNLNQEPEPVWMLYLKLSLPYFNPVKWLEEPVLSIKLLPFVIVFAGWSLFNLYIVRKYLTKWLDKSIEKK